ncbi:MAG: PEP-CTERM sorting domain-containing protein [Cyanobacteriota bacterium]
MLNFTVKSTIAVLTCTLTLGLATGSTAQAAVFKWSFTNVIGGVHGTASGVLRVPSGNDVAATSVILTQTTNPVFAGLVGTDFALLPNFRNQFNVGGGSVTAALFGSDFFANSANLSLEFNAEVFGDDDSENLGLLASGGNPLLGFCPGNCLQTAALNGSNAGQTQFAPTFVAVPEPMTLVSAGVAIAFGAGIKRRQSR